MEEPVFLKSGTSTLDISAQGALANFMVCSHKEANIGNAVKPSSLKFLNHDTWEFSRLTDEQWQRCRQFVQKHPAVSPDGEEPPHDYDAPIPGPVLPPGVTPEDYEDYKIPFDETPKIPSFDEHDDLIPFIFNPQIAVDYRDQVKECTADKRILMLSLVVSPSNLIKWIDSQDSDEASKRVVKLTEKNVKINGHKFRSFTRLTCQPNNGMLGIGGKSAECGFHRALMQLESEGDMYFGITVDNAIMVNGKTGDVHEGPLSASDHNRAAAIFEDGVRGDCGAVDALRTFCEENLTEASLKSLGESSESDRFVVLLAAGTKGKPKITVQLQSSLKRKTIDKINKSKQKVPTDTHNARKMCDKRGSLLKHAQEVYLAIGNFDQGMKTECISVHRYE